MSKLVKEEIDEPKTAKCKNCGANIHQVRLFERKWLGLVERELPELGWIHTEEQTRVCRPRHKAPYTVNDDSEPVWESSQRIGYSERSTGTIDTCERCDEPVVLRHEDLGYYGRVKRWHSRNNGSRHCKGFKAEPDEE